MKLNFRLTCCAALLLCASNFGEAFADEGYYFPSNLSQDHTPQKLPNAIRASVRIVNGHGNCSAALISSDGYVLTAGHCIKECMIKNGFAEWTQNSNPYYEIFRVTAQSPMKNPCTLAISELGVQDPDIILVGKGFTAFDDAHVSQYSPEQIDEFVRNQDDFAILKYSLLKNVPCVSPRWTEVLKGEAVWAVGYPGKNIRAEGLGSNGQSEYISFGKITQGSSESAWVKSRNMSAAEIARLDAYYDKPSQFRSDMDTYPGSSGSMTIDQE